MIRTDRNTQPSRSKQSGHNSFVESLVEKHGGDVSTEALHTTAADRQARMRARIANAAGMPLDLVPDSLDPTLMGPRVLAAAQRLGYVSTTIEPDVNEDREIANMVTSVREARRQRGWSS